MDNKMYFSFRNQRENITELQTYLRYISRFLNRIPMVAPDGIFGPETKAAIVAFQKLYGLPATGEADYETWTRIVETFDELQRAEKNVRPVYVYPLDIPTMKEGDDFEEVYILQIMLRRLAKIFGNIHIPEITGVFDEDTKKAVRDVSKLYGKNPSGEVDRELWNIIAEIYSAFTFND